MRGAQTDPSFVRMTRGKERIRKASVRRRCGSAHPSSEPPSSGGQAGRVGGGVVGAWCEGRRSGKPRGAGAALSAPDGARGASAGQRAAGQGRDSPGAAPLRDPGRRQGRGRRASGGFWVTRRRSGWMRGAQTDPSFVRMTRGKERIRKASVRRRFGSAHPSSEPPSSGGQAGRVGGGVVGAWCEGRRD